jgi:class 3 adenylate cyclase
VAAQTFADLSLRQEFAEPAARIAEQYRRSASGDVVAELIVQNAERDVRPLLSSVRAQSLILHRLEDALYPSEQAQELAAGIPNSRLVALQGSAHEFALDDTEPIHTAIDDFLPERTVAVAERFQAGAMVSVLFTDLVGHVEMMQRLGDAKGRDVLRDHEAITRDVLKKHGGAELKTSGDGFMASFASMTSAVECAVALQRAFAERNKAADEPLHVRVGLNAGEPIAEDGDLFGATVILAARIAAYAGAGEILIPELLRHLLAGKGFFFGDRGDFLPKGFEEPVRLLEVRWQDGAKAKSAP